METRCPFAEWAPVPGHDHTGPMTGGAAKILHHSTEGDSYPGAFSTYERTGDFPHFTDTFEGGVYRARQHLALDEAATALVHPSGTGETNRDNVIQIEHVGHAATSSSWSAEYLDGIAILCRWIEQQTGCMRAAVAPFVPGARRLSWPEWHGTSGHLGHMHVPFNDHVDPGAMDIRHVLTAGQPLPVPSPYTPGPVSEVTVDMSHLQTQFFPFPEPPTVDRQGWLRVDVPWNQVTSIAAQGRNPSADQRTWPKLDLAVNEDGAGFWVTITMVGGDPDIHPGFYVKWVSD